MRTVHKYIITSIFCRALLWSVCCTSSKHMRTHEPPLPLSAGRVGLACAGVIVALGSETDAIELETLAHELTRVVRSRVTGQHSVDGSLFSVRSSCPP